MEEKKVKFKISKDSETGIKLINLVSKAMFIKGMKKELALKLGFEDTMSFGDEFESKIIGFANPKEDVDFKLFRKPNEYGCYIPRASAKEIKKEIDKIEVIEVNEFNKIIGFNPVFLETLGFSSTENNKFIFITAYENWINRFNGNPDVQQIKMSEYYQLIGE